MTINRRSLSRALCALALAACTTTVDPSNPFDPKTPPAQQAPGKAFGRVDQTVLPGGGQTVKLTGSSGAGSERSAVAGADGKFTFDSIEPDLYYVELRVDGFQPLLRPNVKVLAGQATDVGTLTPVALADAQGALSGTLTFEGGKHPSGAFARIELQSGGAKIFVADAPVEPQSGQFVVRVKPGTYTATGRHDLYKPKAQIGRAHV